MKWYVTSIRHECGEWCESEASMMAYLINGWIYLLHPNLVVRFVLKLRRLPNVAVPRTAADRFLWRKIFDRNPLFPELCDKLRAKQYVARKCPELNIPKVLWSGTDFHDIPDDVLKEPVVLKSNHASGQIAFVDHDGPDRAHLKQQTDRWLSRAYGQEKGEWGYRNIDRKIFVEELLLGPDGDHLLDVNVYVVNGRVQHVQCMRDSYGADPNTTRYDRDGNPLEPHDSPKFTYRVVDVPDQYPRLIELAERLGADFDHIRCDFYLVGDAIYFGELTLYALSGYPEDDSWLEKRWQRNWDLRQSWFLSTPQVGWRRTYAHWLTNRLNDRD